MDVTPSAGSFTITMPPANEASPGETALFFNAGSFNFTVADNAGNTIVAITPGLAYQVYLTTNTTVAGTWRTTQFGAGTSSATAGSLVGAGIKAINTTLNQSMAVTSLSVNYTAGAADRSAAFLWTGGAGTITLPAASTVGNDWFFHIRNGGTGAISLATTGGELINGTATVDFNPGDSAIIVCDGTGYFTIGFGQAPEFLFDYVSIDLTSQSSPYTLAGSNLNRIAYQFSGTLTTNMQIIVPATIQQYWVGNFTTGGSYTVTVKTSAGTGTVVPRDARSILYCNGTDVVNADTGGISIPILVSQGGTGATNASQARTNLGATSIGNALFIAVDEATARNAIIAAKSGANSDITSLTGLTTPLSVPQGGTGVATFTANGIVYGSGASALAVTVAGTTGQVLVGNTGTAPSWSTLSGIGVTSFSAGSTGLTPSTATTGIVTLAGTLIAANGGTGFASYAVGDLLFASTTTVLSKLADVATGNALISGGIGVAPSYGKIGLTTHISGTLDVGNGGTGTATAFTAGSVVFAGASGVYTQDNGELFWDNANDRLGIGTATPTVKLDVAGGVNNTGAFRSISGTVDAIFGAAQFASGVVGIGSVSNHPVTFNTNLTENMRITTAGNVGIGTSSPARTLSVYSTSSIPAQIESSGADARISIFTSSGSGGQGFVQASSGALLLGSSNTERMRIDASGNVGIGEPTPSSKLTVGANPPSAGAIAAVCAAAGTSLALSDNTNSSLYVRHPSGAPATIGTDAGGALAFATDGTSERVRIDSSGNLLVNTTTAIEKLTIGSTTATTSGINQRTTQTDFAIKPSNTAAGGVTLEVGWVAGGQGPLIFNLGGEKARITSAGGLAVGTTTDPGAGNIGLAAGKFLQFSSTAYMTPEDNVAGARIVTPGAFNLATGGTAVRMTVDGSGNVGIGTSSPGYRLDVEAGDTTANTGYAMRLRSNATATAAAMQFTNNAVSVENGLISCTDAGALTIQSGGGSSNIKFRTNGAERASISSDGHFGMGTSTRLGTNETLSVSATSTFDGMWVKNLSAAAVTAVIWNAATSGDNSFISFATEAAVTGRGSITYNRAGGLVAYNVTSDYRAKDIIGPVTDAGATIDALKVYAGKMKGATVVRPMLIAHEAQEVVPYAVTGEKDAVNEDGTDKHQQMDHQSLIPLLIAEIQSLRARVAQLEGN